MRHVTLRVATGTLLLVGQRPTGWGASDRRRRGGTLDGTCCRRDVSRLNRGRLCDVSVAAWSRKWTFTKISDLKWMYTKIFINTKIRFKWTLRSSVRKISMLHIK